MHRDARTEADVLVVGGGPAGATTAALLARAGLHVVVADRARFPRAKACAEFLSPEAARILDRLGVLGEVERASHARLTGLMVRAPSGCVVRGDYVAAHGFRAFREHAFALPRTTLDPILLDRARCEGAHVVEGARVTDVLRENGTVIGVRASVADANIELRARLVVGADGLRSVIARRLGLAHHSRWPRRLGLVAHFRNVAELGDLGEMHVERDGFVGIAAIGSNLANVSLVVPARRALELRGDAAGFMHRWLASHPHLTSRFADAEREGPVMVTGPFASHARRAWTDGAALVGDAADFFDPFTGEGIYAALRGAELLEQSLLGNPDALGSQRAQRRALSAYQSARVAEFRGKWQVERIIGLSVAFAPLVNRAARVLASRRDLADLLVGVVGDFVPPSEVLTASYLYTLFLRPA
jgi:menaquinone-9 beta-reductase